MHDDTGSSSAEMKILDSRLARALALATLVALLLARVPYLAAH